MLPVHVSLEAVLLGVGLGAEGTLVDGAWDLVVVLEVPPQVATRRDHVSAHATQHPHGAPHHLRVLVVIELTVVDQPLSHPHWRKRKEARLSI